jgi:hypothetical protein
MRTLSERGGVHNRLLPEGGGKNKRKRQNIYVRDATDSPTSAGKTHAKHTNTHKHSEHTSRSARARGGDVYLINTKIKAT